MSQLLAVLSTVVAGLLVAIPEYALLSHDLASIVSVIH